MIERHVNGFAFVGHTMLGMHPPGRRRDEDFVERVSEKLRAIVTTALDQQLQIVWLAPLARNRFDVRVLSLVLDILAPVRPIFLATENERNETGVDPHSLIGILHKAGRADVISEAGVVGRFTMPAGHGEQQIYLYGLPEGQASPLSLGFSEGLPEGHTTVVAAYQPYSEASDTVAGLAPREIPGCREVFNGFAEQPAEQSRGMTRHIDTGPVTRFRLAQEALTPSFCIWRPTGDIERQSLPCTHHVFDHQGHQPVEQARPKDDFVRLFAESLQEEGGGGSLLEVLDVVRTEQDACAPVWEITDALAEEAVQRLEGQGGQRG